MRRLVLVALLFISGFVVAPNLQAQREPLLTSWADEVIPDNVLPEYPRPQMVREEWLNLNGLWEYAITNWNGEQPAEFQGEILVPFPIESYLSGVQERIHRQLLWYHRTFSVPEGWRGERILLHFGAVDWEATVYVNGIDLGTHRGGYDPFWFDITEALRDGTEQDVVVRVWDMSDGGTQPRGKQVRYPGGIWYTPSTGIWQTVWLEPVPSTFVSGLKIQTDIDAGILTLEARLGGDSEGDDYTVTTTVLDGGDVVASATGDVGEALDVALENPRLWSPDSPFLYDLQVTLLRNDAVIDEVTGYFGMREIAVEPDDEGVLRLALNHEPLFQFGLLDQGFWPDGLYTAPTDEALRHDIEVTRQLGFNLIRKHVKVEPARWYYWADRLGVLVWQDMPNGDLAVNRGEGELERSEESAAQFELELQRLIDTHYNHPSIVMWVVFNEGWGQYDTARLAQWVQDYDPSRLVNSASGWNDVGAGHVFDIHSYPGPEAPPPDPDRALVLGEFGGLGLPIEDHTWLDEANWGYREFTDRDTLVAAYADLIESLRRLQETRGLAAAVYTQTTDVETEVNGMMTYDRAVIKMEPDAVYALNCSLYGQRAATGCPTS